MLFFEGTSIIHEEIALKEEKDKWLIIFIIS